MTFPWFSARQRRNSASNELALLICTITQTRICAQPQSPHDPRLVASSAALRTNSQAAFGEREHGSPRSRCENEQQDNCINNAHILTFANMLNLVHAGARETFYLSRSKHQTVEQRYTHRTRRFQTHQLKFATAESPPTVSAHLHQLKEWIEIDVR